MLSTESRRRRIALTLTAVLMYGLYELNVRVQTHLGEAAVKATGLKGEALPAALTQARAEAKPVLAEVAAIWCPTCRAFDREVLSDPGVNGLLRSRFVYSRLEYESAEGREFSARHGIRRFPRFLVLDPHGTELGRIEAIPDARQFEDRLEAFAADKARVAQK